MGIRAHPTHDYLLDLERAILLSSLAVAGQTVRPSPSFHLADLGWGRLLNRSIFDPFTFLYSSGVR
jgi:hypothetical protein